MHEETGSQSKAVLLKSVSWQEYPLQPAQLDLMRSFPALTIPRSNDHRAVAGFHICFYHRSKLRINTPSENQVLINAVSPRYTNSSITGPVTPCRNTGLEQQGSLQVGGIAIPQAVPLPPHSPKHFLQEFLHVTGLQPVRLSNQESQSKTVEN